jgi:hypothetical protein
MSSLLTVGLLIGDKTQIGLSPGGAVSGQFFVEEEKKLHSM